MKIKIKYDSAWQNSFLDGSNNEPLPKGGRSYIGSSTSLKDSKVDNYIQREITHDTVLGLLNRLIGDQRKLYQSRESEQYWFKELEDKITFTDTKQLSHEVVFLRNMSGSTDKNAFAGMIKSQVPLFNSVFSDELWGVLSLSFTELVDFILDSSYQVPAESYDPLKVVNQFNQLSALKDLIIDTRIQDILDVLNGLYPNENYIEKNGKVKPHRIYCAGMYIQLKRLSIVHDTTAILAKKGGLAGISKRGFTPRDFMKTLSTGGNKLVYGNPYTRERKVKGEGSITDMLNKASGVLEIDLAITDEQANELNRLIECAGVSAFYVGKKGLAYVDSIRC
jgi:hypothetical protein